MKKPLVYFAASFIFGIVFAFYFSIPLWILFFCGVFVIAVAYSSLNKPQQFIFYVLVGFFITGAMSFSISKIFPLDHIKNFTCLTGQDALLNGTVLSEPIQKKNKSVFILDAQYLKILGSTHKVRGKVLVWCFNKEQININDKITAQGKLYQPYAFKMGQRMDYSKFLNINNIFSQFSIKGDSVLVVEKKYSSNIIARALLALKKRTRIMISKNLSAAAGGVIRAMMLGDRTQVPDFLNKQLQCSGTVHVLAVSGLHTGIVILIALTFFKMFSMHYRLRYIFVILILWLYCWFTGNRISVFRATVMGSIFLFAKVINREYDGLSALSLSALIILWINPNDLFNAGFQLSFLSVLSIFLFAPGIIKIMPDRYNDIRALQVLMQGASVSFAAWIGTIGIVSYYFNIFTPVSILANLIIIPLLFLIILSAILFISLGLIFPALAPALALNCEFFVCIMYKVNSLLISIPRAYMLLDNITLKSVFIYYLLLIVICFSNQIKDTFKTLRI